MSFFGRLFGFDDEQRVERGSAAPVSSRRVPTEDERAIERYRYLMRTAPPETLEQVHAEAFSKLSEEQRAMIYEELSRGAGTGERPLSSEPATLARAATRLEMRRPGSMERILNPADGAPAGAAGVQGPSFGSMFASSLLGSVAGYVIGSALVSAFLPWGAGDLGAETAADTGADASGEGMGLDGGVDDGGGFDLFSDFGF